jgi:hypothetical protein
MGSVAHTSGLLAAFLGRTDQAVALFEHAIARNMATHQAPRTAESRYALARILLLSKAGTASRKSAGELLDTARMSATTLGMQPLLERCERLRGESK